MAAIQVDMFEVQLGAAVLLQFETDGRVVRVLADAGVKASGYKNDHVYKKIRRMLPRGDSRLDLVIGTHYDEDHLRGLIPIIEDESIDIGEAWMPPVANDAEDFAVDAKVEPASLLAHQFYGPNGTAKLHVYLQSKASDIKYLQGIELILQGGSRDLRTERQSQEQEGVNFFYEQLGASENDINHASDLEIDEGGVVNRLLDEFVAGEGFLYASYFGSYERLQEYARHLRRERPELAQMQARTLANIRGSAAKHAINAVALHDVVQALNRRGIPLRTHVISRGVPKTFRWNPAAQRFQLARAHVQGLKFTLLGPSRSLVRKHRHRLPIADVCFFALSFRGELKGISASNQLSYIGCFSFLGQSVLISGDAGCVDFSDGRGGYYAMLLDALKSVHVVQVAHHGGNNDHFYRVLKAAGYPGDAGKSFLLLSHAYHDRKRPSETFNDFVMTTLGGACDIEVLFTSTPLQHKVVDYIDAIGPVVGPRDSVGDVQLSFDASHWSVTRHAISV
jgi:beta-lactamase superfamily II metal-dependent hydrolase